MCKLDYRVWLLVPLWLTSCLLTSLRTHYQLWHWLVGYLNFITICIVPTCRVPIQQMPRPPAFSLARAFFVIQSGFPFAAGGCYHPRIQVHLNKPVGMSRAEEAFWKSRLVLSHTFNLQPSIYLLGASPLAPPPYCFSWTKRQVLQSCERCSWANIKF